MAQATSSGTGDIAEILNEAIKEGKNLTEYLLMDATHLDAAEGRSNNTTLQLDAKTVDVFRRQWSQYVETSYSDVRLVAIADALASLRVGADAGGREAYLARRNVDVGIFPQGHNISMTLVQDKPCFRDIPKVSASCLTQPAFDLFL